jgi:hypothetical protein
MWYRTEESSPLADDLKFAILENNLGTSCVNVFHRIVNRF